MKKEDKDKVLDLIERLTNSHVDCFNREATLKYMQHFTDMIYDSLIYNNTFCNLHLKSFQDLGINDTSEGFDKTNSDIKKVEEDLKRFFSVEYKKALKTKLPIHFAELDKMKKEEKSKEKESKGKK